MRNLIMWNLVTLDGYFEGAKSWDLDWHNYAWGEELERFSIEQLKTIDALLFGRVTYEGMASYWTTAKGEVAESADAMNRIPKIVFSKTLARGGVEQYQAGEGRRARLYPAIEAGARPGFVRVRQRRPFRRAAARRIV